MLLEFFFYFPFYLLKIKIKGVIGFFVFFEATEVEFAEPSFNLGLVMIFLF